MLSVIDLYFTQSGNAIVILNSFIRVIRCTQFVYPRN